jgi:hypothetical protein
MSSMGVGDASARQLIRLQYHSTIGQTGHLLFRRPVGPVRWSVRVTSNMARSLAKRLKIFARRPVDNSAVQSGEQS